MSKLFVYQKFLDTLGPMSGQYVQTQSPINTDGKFALRIIRASLTPEIPNVFVDPRDGTFTNKMNVSLDAGVTWDEIAFPPGFFTIDRLQVAIARACVDLGYCADLTLPPIFIGASHVNGYTYMVIDSTKLVPPVLGAQIQVCWGGGLPGLDPQQLNRMDLMLGYNREQILIGDGLKVAPNAPFLDWQGSSIQILFGVTGTTFLMGNVSQIVAEMTIPASTSYSGPGSGRSFDFPAPGQISPSLSCDLPRQFTGMTIRFVNNYNGKDILALYGAVYLSFIIEYLGA
jgi:hypothetical protein